MNAPDCPVMPKKSSDKVSSPPTKAVKIDKSLATKAQMIATDRGLDLSSYLSDCIRANVDRDWSKMVKKVGDDERTSP